ncbi:DUF523 and DUF1722 domain-containing protein [Reinekea marina]|uniref:YbgA family protein n=1 Tax=Reinekea marina TaxID=1310421 RepID=A0ABV7WQV7_9GAMM|nr:DUF523 and DUF1722 domain-containing protein [Reinekea marina]MDN3648072.1 DUF523 and DUF1722 domain-containing protein [Reinekea marina]
METTIKIGISSCLLGEKVRFDSGHKLNKYATDVLGQYFEFVPFCPEVSIGLPIPRAPIRLIAKDGDIRCVGVKDDTIDVTDELKAKADEQVHWHQDLCGYILKHSSPSCGMERVKVYTNAMPTKTGVGIYAKQLLKNFPNLPVEEEGRLEDPHLRENFIQRVFVYSRWRALIAGDFSIGQLQKFHAQHKYIFMSHDQVGAKALGAILANTKDFALEEVAEQYVTSMMQLLKKMAPRKGHVNTLKHIQGYLKRSLDTEDKQELNDIVEQYRQGLVPLIVPVTLLRHHFRRHPHDYIDQSYYLAPHPNELMLLNRI